ncbi:MAG: DUF86 domain-containing protein [Armatimonadetes bacterium]|nr:DUF86 domain-containing protein [Armatimonadota bacterium]
MRRDPATWLEDILTHGREALTFIEGKSEADYVADRGLQAMVERKLFIVGEAVSQIGSVFPEIGAQLSDKREIVGFRNLLAHAYFALDHKRVYDIARNSLPALVDEAERLLGSIEEQGQ